VLADTVTLVASVACRGPDLSFCCPLAKAFLSPVGLSKLRGNLRNFEDSGIPEQRATDE